MLACGQRAPRRFLPDLARKGLEYTTCEMEGSAHRQQLGRRQRNHVSAILCFAVISSSISLLGPLGPSPRALKTRLGRADPSQATKAWLPAVKSKVSLPESASYYRSWRGIGGTATYSGVALTQVIRLDH